jgi:hypothetical protein
LRRLGLINIDDALLRFYIVKVRYDPRFHWFFSCANRKSPAQLLDFLGCGKQSLWGAEMRST